jgi:hypothetical protein
MRLVVRLNSVRHFLWSLLKKRAHFFGEMEPPCPECKSRDDIRLTDYGTLVCTRCGVENFTWILSAQSSYSPYCVPLHSQATYTRIKRFRKYLQRASMQQSQSTIPESTWEYLLQGCKHKPYHGPASIVRRLKKAPKSVRKKCYDSLPLLCKMLCPHINVPRLTESNKLCAMNAFRKLDAAYNNGEPFVSYLYALEFILDHIGRSDVLPFINKICCRNRRTAYQARLNKIFSSSPRIPA